MVAGAEGGDFFDHLLLLVDLDRIHAAKTTFVIQVGNGLIEAIVELFDAGVENVTESQQNGQIRAALTGSGDNVLQANRNSLVAVFQPHAHRA